jgi:PPP family 3-phenylpropionic acid transporter
VIALRFVVLTLGVALGVFYPFISVILADLGFRPAEIGLIASIGAVGFTLSVPAWGHLADVRFGRPLTLQICAGGAALAVAAMTLPLPAVLIAALFMVFWVFESAWQPLADALTVNAVDGRSYARVRSLTSLSFAAGAIVAGFVYDRTGYGAAFVAFVVASLAMAIAARHVPDVGRAVLGDDRGHGPGAAAGRVARLGSAGVALRVAPRLALVLVAVSLLHVGIISGFTFLPLRIGEIGGQPSDVALAAGLSAAVEIPTMLVAGGVARRIGLRGMFVGSALIYAAALGSWIVLEVPAAIIVTRAFTGIAFAGAVVAVVLTVATLLPAQLQATGQSLYQTMAFGIAAIIANIVGGTLYGAIGHEAVFGLGALMAVAAATLGFWAFPRDATRRRADGGPATA